tara:strand:+ start:657 stop:1133 length:477 start_codon:yes stop_codon:yes gene_type:complete
MVKKNKKINIHVADFGPLEARKHGTFVEEDTMVAGIKRVRNVTTDPIETMWNRQQIDKKQYDAADRFAQVFRQAQLAEVYATVRFGEIKGAPSLEAQESMAKAKSEVRASLAFVGYPLASLLEHVVGNCHTPSSWPKGNGNLNALKLALDGLVEYYKL